MAGRRPHPAPETVGRLPLNRQTLIVAPPETNPEAFRATTHLLVSSAAIGERNLLNLSCVYSGRSFKGSRGPRSPEELTSKRQVAFCLLVLEKLGMYLCISRAVATMLQADRAALTALENPPEVAARANPRGEVQAGRAPEARRQEDAVEAEVTPIPASAVSILLQGKTRIFRDRPTPSLRIFLTVGSSQSPGPCTHSLTLCRRHGI